MAVTIRFSAGLRDWITGQLQRGTPPRIVVEALVAKDFKPEMARGLVEAFVRAQAAGVPPPRDELRLALEAPPYRYETPRISAAHVIHAAGREIRVLQRLQRPVVLTLANVIGDEECARLIDLARPRLKPSTTVDSQTGGQAVADRRSEGMFFLPGENAFIAELDARFSALMNGPVAHGEGLQVLRYGQGGEYPPHFDFLVPGNPANAQSILRSGQRVSTLIAYLNEVPEGGETVFPEVGLSVIPRRGHAVYFEYANAQGQLDPRSLHAGAPVIQGEKWVVTKWIRSQTFISG